MNKLMIRSCFTAAAALGLVALASCDPNATASSKGELGSGQLSRQYETCGASIHCEKGLRCLEGICLSQTRSPVGDYHAAAGRRALADGEPARAVRHYADAVSAYSTAKLEPPTSLYCEQGHALAAARSEQKNAELAARVLHHRCLTAIPVGSRYRAQALADMALLGKVGLDPGLLARSEAADRYLTKAPLTPEVKEVKVKVTGPRTRARSYTALIEAIGQPAVAQSMRPCFEAYVKATKKKSVTVRLPFRSRYHEGQYEEDDGYRLAMEKDTPPAAPALATAHNCVKAVVEPLVKPIARKGGSWRGDVAITLSM